MARRASATASVRPIAHLSLVDRVTDELHRAILNGDIAPGSAVSIVDLCEQFAVSHIPVREALRRLESEGLLSLRPGRSALVASLSVEDLVGHLPASQADRGRPRRARRRRPDRGDPHRDQGGAGGVRRDRARARGARRRPPRVPRRDARRRRRVGRPARARHPLEVERPLPAPADVGPGQQPRGQGQPDRRAPEPARHRPEGRTARPCARPGSTTSSRARTRCSRRSPTADYA